MRPARLFAIGLLSTFLAGTAHAANLLETMRSNPNLSTFVGLIDKAGMASQFTGAQPLTVLAPTNGAFDSVGASQMRTLEDPQRLRTFILSHVVEGTRVWGGGGTEHTTANVRSLAGTNFEVEMTGGGAATIHQQLHSTGARKHPRRQRHYPHDFCPDRRTLSGVSRQLDTALMATS